MHVIADEPLSFIGLSRQAGDALCRPLIEFRQPLESGPQTGCAATCFACVMRLDRLVAAGVVKSPRPGVALLRELDVSTNGTAGINKLELRIAVHDDVYIDVGNATYSAHASTQTEVIDSDVLLHTNQSGVHMPQVKFDKRVGRRIDRSGLLPEIVVDYRDRYWIVDGHHRMVASRTGGSPGFLGYVHRAMFYVPEGELVSDSPSTQLGARPLFAADEVAAVCSPSSRNAITNFSREFAQPIDEVRFVKRRLSLRSLPAVRHGRADAFRVHELADLMRADTATVEPLVLCPLGDGFRIDVGSLHVAAARRARLTQIEAFVAIPPDGLAAPTLAPSPYLAR